MSDPEGQPLQLSQPVATNIEIGPCNVRLAKTKCPVRRVRLSGKVKLAAKRKAGGQAMKKYM